MNYRYEMIEKVMFLIPPAMATVWRQSAIADCIGANGEFTLQVPYKNYSGEAEMGALPQYTQKTGFTVNVTDSG